MVKPEISCVRTWFILVSHYSCPLLQLTYFIVTLIWLSERSKGCCIYPQAWHDIESLNHLLGLESETWKRSQEGAWARSLFHEMKLVNFFDFTCQLPVAIYADMQVDSLLPGKGQVSKFSCLIPLNHPQTIFLVESGNGARFKAVWVLPCGWWGGILRGGVVEGAGTAEKYHWVLEAGWTKLLLRCLVKSITWLRNSAVEPPNL